MWLERLEADRLRNLRAVGIGLPPGLVMLCGRNGQGKTSLLEAAYLLATGRSFRTRRSDELVSFGGGPLRVAGRVIGRLGPTGLGVVIDGAERRLLVDEAPSDLESFLGRLDVVDLSAQRMNVLRGAPPDRRRFLDRGVVGLRPSFLRSLAEYRRVLNQRNALLRGAGRTSGGPAEAQLDVWDERLAAAAREVHFRRREYAVLLSGHLGPFGRMLFPDGGEIRLHYRPSPAGAAKAEVADFTETYMDELRSGRTRDRQLGHTCRGPHRDDLLVELDGVDLRRFGSAGQVRATMIALKLGKLSLLQKQKGEVPVFLMDDFDSDLDEVRAAALAEHLHRGGFQALVATSKEGMTERIGVPFTKILLSEGTVREK